MAKYLIVLCMLMVSSLAAVPRRIINPNFDSRIVGGSAAEDGAHPYHVSFQFFGFHVCGGAIVDNEWVITAAQCVVDFIQDVRLLNIYAGSNRISFDGVEYDVLEIHYHQDYDPWKIKNDVAMLKVEPLTYNDRIQPITCETEDVGGDEDVFLIGWGQTWSSPIPEKLQILHLKTTTLEYCQSRHTTNPVIESEICTFTKDGEGACYGDSGGPLVKVVDGEHRLVGVSSWARPCGVGYPDVYSRVSSFYDWFNSTCNCL